MTRQNLIALTALFLPTAYADIFKRLPSFLNSTGHFVEAQSVQTDATGKPVSVVGSDKAVYPMSVVNAGRVTVTSPNPENSYLTVSSLPGRTSGETIHVYRVFKKIVDPNGRVSFLVGTDQENQLIPIEQTQESNVKFQSKGEVLDKINAAKAAKIDFGWDTLRVMAQSRASSERTEITELLEAAQKDQAFAQTRTALRWLPALERVLKVSAVVDARLLRTLELSKKPAVPALTTQELVRQIPATAAE